MEGFLYKLLRRRRRVFEKNQLAIGVMVVAVVQALSKARAEVKD